MFGPQARSLLALLSVTLVLWLPVLGVLHAFVPHTHTDAETEHAQLLNGLSLGLGRQDFVSVAEAGGMLFIAVLLDFLASLALVPSRALARRPSAAPSWRALHRGIFAYRRFG